MPVLRLHGLLKKIIYWTIFSDWERLTEHLYNEINQGVRGYPPPPPTLITNRILLRYLGLSLRAYLIFALVQYFDTELSVVRQESHELYLGSLREVKKTKLASIVAWVLIKWCCFLLKQSTLISLLGPITSIWTPSMTPITWGILQLLNSTNLVITSAVSLSVFRNTMKPEANSVIQLQNSFVISAAAYFVTENFFAI